MTSPHSGSARPSGRMWSGLEGGGPGGLPTRARTASAVTAAGDDRKAGECGGAHRTVKRSAD